ncbi:MAG: heterodisulfide reductase-related iron-sulfur binding cluster [Chloroflexi bacterium]|nr:heterodisulfide reductase-related iron-sulfur binding cluster [Chloroflexota bacterium]
MTSTSTTPSAPPIRIPLGFVGPDIPAADDLANCIHCGFCLPSCPTYVATGQELESPRGRLHLISGVRDGRIEANDRVLGHLDLCLQCRACETACPSAVPYGRIMEDARAAIMANPAARRPRAWSLRSLALRHVIARPRVLRLALGGARLYTRTGLRDFARRYVLPRLPAAWARIEASTPALDQPAFRETGTLASPPNATARVALLLGCLHGEMYPQMHRATVTALEHAGCEVVAPPAQGCCGALHAHAGDAEAARSLARRNIEAFEQAGVDAIIVNAAGCGAAMKEYGRLLRHDARWAERAEAFSSRVKDALEYVADRQFDHDLGNVDRTVTLQDACHLAHAQRIREAPRRILGAIPGVTLREMVNPDRCCGSAGLYSVVQSRMSAQVLEPKMASIAATGADTVCTANPGCTLQIETGTRRHKVDAEVRHVIEVLAESIEAGRRSPS